MFYRLLFKLFLTRLDPELAHRLASGMVRAVAAASPLRVLLRRLAVPRANELEVHALGKAFPSPLGVAAGVDKDATWFEGLAALGFGFVEVGTITANPQAGNPGRRVVRLTEQRALLNSMGFPNPGAQRAAQRLSRRRSGTIVGVNVGRSRAAARELAEEDYRATVRALGPFADYLVVNVSSPNTAGLRQLQALASLRPLLAGVRAELLACGREVPLLVKIAPDLSDEQVDAIAELALSAGLDGIVAVNTTVDRGSLTIADAASLPEGGISGAPLKRRALEVLERLHQAVGDQLVLISVGGIETPEDVWERILAGATLVQAYTGFVYGGPGWPRRVNRALAARVRDAGRSSIQELIGTGKPSCRVEAVR